MLMLVVGWTIWSAVAVLTLFYWGDIFADVFAGQRPTYALLSQALLFTLLLIATAIAHGLNKLHLLWLTPVMFVAGILLSPSSIRRQ